MTTETILTCVLLGLTLLSTLLVVASVGKVRKPTTPGTAAFIVFMNLLYSFALFYIGTH